MMTEQVFRLGRRRILENAPAWSPNSPELAGDGKVERTMGIEDIAFKALPSLNQNVTGLGTHCV